jgi:hypothetical protein
MAISGDIFQREASQIISEIKARLLSTGANATGKTAASLSESTSDERLIIYGGKSFGTNERDKRGYVEAGRGPGKLPPFKDIQEWAIARGIVKGSDERAKRIIDGIRWKIKNDGTNIFIRKNPRDIYFDVITPDRTNDIIDQVQGVFAQKVLSEIVQQFKN